MTPQQTKQADSRTDEALAAAASAGEPAAQNELIRRHYRHVAGLAYRMLGRPDAAEDATQDVFVRLLSGKSAFAGRSRFSTWLTRVVLNLCIDYRRRKRPTQKLPDDIPQQPSSSHASDEAYIAQRIRSALEQLPERQRTAVILHRYHDQSYRQIAATTGWSESAVESLIIRAYAALREELKDLNDK